MTEEQKEQLYQLLVDKFDGLCVDDAIFIMMHNEMFLMNNTYDVKGQNHRVYKLMYQEMKDFFKSIINYYRVEEYLLNGSLM